MITISRMADILVLHGIPFKVDIKLTAFYCFLDLLYHIYLKFFTNLKQDCTVFRLKNNQKNSTLCVPCNNSQL